MDKNGTERIYPAAPLETNIAHEEQQQKLLAPAPPTYEQTIAATPATIHQPTTTTTGAAVPATAPTAPHIVVVTQPIATPYGPHPVDVTCPFCHNQARTRLRYKPSSKTHLIAGLLCLFQLYCCICLPYCINSCMNTNHYCGMCDRYLGTYLRP